MIVFWILLVLFLLLLFVFTLKVHLIFDFHQKLTVTLKILWLRFDGYQLLEKLGQRKDDQNKTSSKSSNTRQKGKKNGKVDLIGFAEFLGHLAKVITLGLKEFLAKSTVDLKELIVTIGSDDAAETALITGAVMQGANGLCAALQHFSKFRCDNRKLSIAPDFTSEKSSISFHLVMTCKFIDIIGIFFRTYTRFFERKEDNHARNSIKTGH